MTIPVIFPFVGDTIGGSHVSMIKVLREVSAFGVSPFILVHYAGPFSKYLDQNGINHQVLNQPLTELSVPRELKKLHLHIIVHTNDNRMHLLWSQFCRTNDLPHIWHQRSFLNDKTLINELNINHSKRHLICASEFIWSTLPSMQSTDLTVLYSPFVQPPQQRSCKGNEKEEKSRPVISFIANLTKQKNPKIFLEAIAKAQGALRSDTQILICGSEREYLHKEIISYSKKIDLNLDLQVKGFQSSITPIMEESDLIICPFHNEGFGRVSVEAMLLSTPVIALNEAGFKEVRNFFPEIELVNDLTASAFANAIISFSQNKKIFLGRRMVPYKLTLNHHLECLFNIYQRLTLQHQT